MRTHRVRRVVLSFAIPAIAAFATGSSAGTFAVSTGVRGVVDLYDLTSATPTRNGFSIRSVAVSDHFPTLFGPVAYRVSREEYDCATGHYIIAEMREFDRGGRVLNEVGRTGKDDMEVVAGTAGAEMYDRFCAEGRGGVRVGGLAPKATVEQENPFAAYEYARSLLEPAQP